MIASLKFLDKFTKKVLLANIQQDLKDGATEDTIYVKYDLAPNTARRVCKLLMKERETKTAIPQLKQTRSLKGKAKKDYELWKKLNSYEGDNCGFNFSVL